MPTEATEIESLANREYRWGFVTDIEADAAPPGLNEGHRAIHLAQKERAGLDASVATEGVSPLAHDERAALGRGEISGDQLSGHDLIFRAQGEEVELRRSRSRIACDV
jgi:hypothetical protein